MFHNEFYNVIYDGVLWYGDTGASHASHHEFSDNTGPKNITVDYGRLFCYETQAEGTLLAVSTSYLCTYAVIRARMGSQHQSQIPKI